MPDEIMVRYRCRRLASGQPACGEFLLRLQDFVRMHRRMQTTKGLWSRLVDRVLYGAPLSPDRRIPTPSDTLAKFITWAHEAGRAELSVESEDWHLLDIFVREMIVERLVVTTRCLRCDAEVANLSKRRCGYNDGPLAMAIGDCFTRPQGHELFSVYTVTS